MNVAVVICGCGAEIKRVEFIAAIERDGGARVWCDGERMMTVAIRGERDTDTSNKRN